MDDKKKKNYNLMQKKRGAIVLRFRTDMMTVSNCGNCEYTVHRSGGLQPANRQLVTNIVVG